MQPLLTGRYRADLAAGAAEIDRAMALREVAFRQLRGRPGADADAWDGRCEHMLITDVQADALVACFRLLPLQAAEVHTSYAAQFHDITVLSRMSGLLVEVGRFCMVHGVSDPDVMRLALAGMMVRATGAKLLFGCASFAGADPARHRPALSYLSAHHLAPDNHNSGTALQHGLPLPLPDAETSPTGLPPLLRAWLGLGAWVAPNVVADHDLDTLHVLVGVEVARIPPARLRSLRALAAAASVPG